MPRGNELVNRSAAAEIEHLADGDADVEPDRVGEPIGPIGIELERRLISVSGESPSTWHRVIRYGARMRFTRKPGALSPAGQFVDLADERRSRRDERSR
jgi:hypothetical protein